MREWINRVVVAGVCVAAGLALVSPATAQSRDERRRQREMQEQMQREARPVLIVVDHLQADPAGAEAQAFVVNPKESDPVKAMKPGDVPLDTSKLAWRCDFMKAADGKVYVPYTLTVPADALPSGPVSVYLRVVASGQAPAAAQKEGEEKKSGESRFAFEDFYSLEPRATAGVVRITRAFAAAPGEYDVYYGIRPKPADPKKARDEQAVRVVAYKKAALAVPNFWNGELTTSTVVVTNKVEQFQGQVTPEVQRERPYLFGTTEFAPSPDNVFKKSDELSIVFQIYNPTLQEGKPDVTIEYAFHRKLPEGEKYFNKTNPQQLNAQSLPPNFDVVAMQMLPGGQSVPLASFPEGEYRLEIKVTDNVAKKSITRDVTFTVVS
jgi:hypothetical protein